MKQAGLLAVVDRDGWQYNSNGSVVKPACDITYGRRITPADCSCNNATCYEPGGGDDLGYPVIGQVAVNYSNNSYDGSYWQGAIFMGDYGIPSGPHLGLPQLGFGAKYIVNYARCVAGQGEKLLAAATAMVAFASRNPNWNSKIAQAVVKALAKWGPKADWAISAAADFILSLAATFAFATFTDFVVAAGVGYSLYVAVAVVLACSSGYGG